MPIGKSPRPIHVPKVIAVRVDQVTAIKLAEVAAERGVLVSDVMRSIVTRALSTTSPIPLRRRHLPNGELLASTLGELGKVGADLNQMSKHLNSKRSVEGAALLRSLTELAEILGYLRDLIGGVRNA